MSRQHLFSRIHVLFAAAIVAGIFAGLGVGTARPQPAHADAEDVLDAICTIVTLSFSDGCGTPFGTAPRPAPPPPPVCDVRDVMARVTATEYRYQYILACDLEPLSAVQVTGIYEPSTRRAEEQLTRLALGGGGGTVRWNCPVDPWSLPSGDADCSPVGQGPLVTLIATLDMELPFSVFFLDGADRRQLERALEQAQPADVTRLPGDLTRQPGTGTPAPPAPTKPDLAAVRVNGPTTLRQGMTQGYAAEIKNEGLDANGTVELHIIFYGALQPGLQETFSAAAGLFCERLDEVAAGTTGAVRCVGGTLKQGQAASVDFTAWATKQGPGNIVVEINPRRTLDESDYNDNRTPAFRVDVN